MTITSLKSYNHKDSILALTSYPPKASTYGQHQDAVASFAKNRLLSLQKKLTSQNSGRIVVLTSYTIKPEIYEEDGLLILRVFKRNHPLTFINILKAAKKFNHINSLLIEFEFATFGDTFMTITFPFLLMALKLLGKAITIELHQVLLNLADLSGHLGLNQGSLKLKLFSSFIRSFYSLTGSLADRFIVLENSLKHRLSKLVNKEKISVIPHGVDSSLPKIAKTTARRLLKLPKNDFLVLNFGFLTWYKGSDVIVDAYAQNRLNSTLLLAGGPSFTQNKKSHYKSFYQKTVSMAKRNKNIIHTGFVTEADLPLYFAAADLVVFPYRTFMSSSGPLSLALSFNKPFLLSEPLLAYLKTPKFNHCLKQSGLTASDLSFAVDQHSLASTLNRVANSKTMLKKLTSLSASLSQTRTFEALSSNYLKVLFPISTSAKIQEALALASA